MRTPLAIAVATFSIGAVVACSSFSSAPSTIPDDAAAETANGSDGATDGGFDAASDGATDGGFDAADLLDNGGFEIDGCEGWLPSGSEIASDMVARSGNLSCRVCHINGPVWETNQTVAAVPGARYTATAWVHQTDTDAAPAQIQLGLYALDHDGTSIVSDEGTKQDPTPNWSLVTVTSGTTPPGTVAMRMTVIVRLDVDGCFLVDDAELHRTF